MTCSTSNMKAVFQSVNIDFEIIFRLCVCLLLCILYNMQLASRFVYKYTGPIGFNLRGKPYLYMTNKLHIKFISVEFNPKIVIVYSNKYCNISCQRCKN